MRVLIGILIGCLLGFGYYKLVGCPTGGCPITSNPWTSTLYGALMGLLIATSGGSFGAGTDTKKEETMKDTKEFTVQNWDKEVLKSSKPVLVDFWAPWCGPCRMQGPIVEQLAKDMGDSAVIGKLNSDDNPEIAAQYGIRGIPTLMVFLNGKPKRTFVGVTQSEALKAALQEALN